MKFTNDGFIVDRSGKKVGQVKKVCREVGNGIRSYNHALIVGDVKLFAWDLMELSELINAIGLESPFERDEEKPKATPDVKPKRHRRTKAEMEAARALEAKEKGSKNVKKKKG